MNNLYKDKEFIKDTLQILKDQLKDLEMIDAHNKDLYNNEIQAMKEMLEVIKY